MQTKSSLLTGGERRFEEAFKCFNQQSTRLLSSLKGVLASLLHKNAIYICFDERYLLLLLPVFFLKKKVLFFPRGNKLIHFNGIHGSLRLYTYKVIFSFLYKKCERLIFQTKAQHQEFVATYSYDGCFHILHNHIGASWIRGLREVSPLVYRNNQTLKIGFLGGLSTRKGFSLAYEALLPLIESDLVELNVAGASKESFKDYKVIAHGNVNSLLDFYSGCHLILIPSSYDSFPNVLLESLSAGIIPITTKTEIMREICGNDSPLLFDLDSASIRTMVLRFVDDLNFRATLELECRRLKTKYDFDWCGSLQIIANEVMN